MGRHLVMIFLAESYGFDVGHFPKRQQLVAPVRILPTVREAHEMRCLLFHTVECAIVAKHPSGGSKRNRLRKNSRKGMKLVFESCILNCNLKFIFFRIKVLGCFLLMSLIKN